MRASKGTGHSRILGRAENSSSVTSHSKRSPRKRSSGTSALPGSAAVIAALLTVMAVVLTAHPPQSYADDPDQERFTVQLKYYDDVQINYTVRYPNGGIWTGAGDLPIGGDTSGAVSQLYCVDPFVHFHSIAATSWPGPDHVTTDTMADYSVGAPWSISSSLRNQRDAVSWLVTNGYRGDYLANDAQSRSSVQRLRALYPTILSGLDDHSVRRIGLMATKVAIWKVLENDNVVISRTSLPASQSPLLDSLITAMMADARANRAAAGLTVAATKMEARVLEDVGGATTVTHTPTPGDKVYYGPLQVEVEVDNALNNDPGALDKVFLSALGVNLSTGSGEVRFVTFNSGQVAINFDSPTVLPYGSMYGTGAGAQYLSGSFGVGGGTGGSGAGGGSGGATVAALASVWVEHPLNAA